MTAEIIDGIIQAFHLIFSFDPEIYEIVFRSLYVSGLATAMATLWSIPIAVIIAMKKFRGKRFVKSSFNAFLGMPTVVLGLILYLLIKNKGPFGMFELLYTPLAISIGQAILMTPIIVTFTTTAIEAIDFDIRDLARTLGSTEFQASAAILREAVWGVALAVVAGFNRAFAELGVATMVGGNVLNRTRVLTTTIALEVNRADIEFSIALGVILVLIVFTVSTVLNYIKRR